ncbi:MAG TPA: PIN domain-containing protein [Chloroflexia bacterium]|jgi:predicted nucleic acid-binding protein
MLLDTSGLLCLLHRAEAQHKQALKLYRTASARLVHNYVLAEFVALANARRLPRLAALTFISDLLGNPDIEMVWVDEALHLEALELLFARSDKTYSLCDAVSFVLMRRGDIITALTTDRHFEQEGFQRLLVTDAD